MAPIRPPPGYGHGGGRPQPGLGRNPSGVWGGPNRRSRKFLNFYVESTNGKLSKIHGINFPKLKKICSAKIDIRF